MKSIYDIIPAELNKQNKKFIFTMLNKELKFDRYENSFLWLKDAGVALPVYNEDGKILRYNVFTIELLVRCSGDGKLYLYDMVNIKKETSNPLKLTLYGNKPIS